VTAEVRKQNRQMEKMENRYVIKVMVVKVKVRVRGEDGKSLRVGMVHGKKS
jgi:hypothetical protein